MDADHMDADRIAGPGGSPPAESHLMPERLAALADESPASAEAQHLATCAACSAEVESYRSLLALTRAERDRLSEPLTNWESLREALANDAPESAAPARQHPATAARLRAWATRSAAAVVLVSSGVAVGRYSARPAAPPRENAAAAVAVGKNSVAPASGENGASLVQFAPTSQKFESADDALAAVLNAETQYRHAVAYLMVSDSADKGAGIPNDYATRLAALDEVARTAQAALIAAPHDVVLRRVYTNSVDAREATLRELGRTIPASLHGGQY
jgi:hypothetical protein